MKSNGLYTTSALTKIALTLSLALTPAAVMALPQHGQVVSGVAAIAQGQSRTDIHQQSNKAIVNWNSFDVSRGETVQFHQPSAQSVTLNRVTGSQHPSQIHGNLSANGQVILVNPNGMHFGKSAVVDVNGLIASTANISNANFLAGKMHFNEAGNPNAAIINEGSITVKQGGFAAIVAPSIENSGVIVAQQGTVALAGGEAATFDFYGDKLINFAVSGKAAAGIINSGKISANDGGAVYLTTAQARNVVDNVINTSGVIEASSARVEGGEIILDGGNGGVKVAGSVKATGSKGGKVRVKTSGDVLVDSGAVIDASGENAGGTIIVGGNGKAGETILANTLNVLEGSSLLADATQSGTGGDVILWSTQDTNFEGFISARGNKGGFAEVSSTGLLGFYGVADLRGFNGDDGTLLLDPPIIVIASRFARTPLGGITADTIFNQLKLGDVILEASERIVTVINNTGIPDGSVVQTEAGYEANTLTLKAPTVTFNNIFHLLSNLTIEATTFVANNTVKANALTVKATDATFFSDVTVNDATFDVGSFNIADFNVGNELTRTITATNSITFDNSSAPDAVVTQLDTVQSEDTLLLKAKDIFFDAAIELDSNLTVDATTFTVNEALTTNTLKTNATTFKIGDSFTGTLDSTSTFPQIVILDNDANLDFWLDELDAGGKFDLKAGTYTQTLSLTNKSAIISGDEDGGTIFDLVLPSSEAFLLQGDVGGTSISDLTIKTGSPENGNSQYAAMIIVGNGESVSDITLDNVHISHSLLGLQFSWGIFDDITVKNSTFSNLSTGVHVSSGAAITNSTFTNTQFSDYFYGLYMDQGSALQNVTFNSEGDGKTRFDSGYSGLYLRSSPAVFDAGDTVIQTADITVDGAEFVNNTFGIYLYMEGQSDQNLNALTIKNNLFEDNYQGLYFVQKQGTAIDSLELEGNSFVNNQAHLNWWQYNNYSAFFDAGYKLANGDFVNLKADSFDRAARNQENVNAVFADLTSRNTFTNLVHLAEAVGGSNWLGSFSLYGSIQEAVNNSGANSTNWINVGAGTYNQPLFISQSVNIAGTGANRSDVVIAPDTSGGALVLRGRGPVHQSIVTISAPEVTLQNLTIDGANFVSNSGDVVKTSGVLIQGGDVTLDNIHITNLTDEDSANSGIFIQYGSLGRGKFIANDLGCVSFCGGDSPAYIESNVTLSNSLIDNVSDVGIFLTDELPASGQGDDRANFVIGDLAIVQEDTEIGSESEIELEPNSLTIIDTAIEDADAGLVVAGGKTNVVFNDVAGSSFDGSERFAIELLNGALDNQLLEVGTVSFNGALGSTIIPAIGEALVYDQDDLNTVGDVQFSATSTGGGAGGGAVGGAGGGAVGGATPPTTTPNTPGTPSGPQQPGNPSATPNVPVVIPPAVIVTLLNDALQATNIDSDALVPLVQNLLNQGYSFDDVVAGLSLLSNSQLQSLTTADLGSLEPAAGGTNTTGSTDNQESSCVNNFLDTGFMASFNLQECNS